MNKQVVIDEAFKTIKMSRKQAAKDRSWEGLINSATLLMDLCDKIDEQESEEKLIVGFSKNGGES